jgi:glycosyltransferase involved in cell wall biosynthesis
MKIAFLLDSFAGGGAEKVSLILADEMARRGHEAVIVANKLEGRLLDSVASGVRVVGLKGRPLHTSRLTPLWADPFGIRQLWLPVIAGTPPPKSIRFVRSLRRFLRSERPDVLLSVTPFTTLQAVWAKRYAWVDTRIIGVESIHLSRWLEGRKGRRYEYLVPLLSRTYRRVDRLVGVSDGVADDLAQLTGIPRSSIARIYNPALAPDLERAAQEALEHPWFQEGQPPVLLTVGRLDNQKDHPTLIRAFARIRAGREVRLVILGEAPHARETAARTTALRDLAYSLGVEKDVDLPGYQHNPFRFMRRASVFVLTSRFEGLGNVLIEALACGCPVVSTDCESGPAEILERGKYGRLVAVGDVDGLARALGMALDDPGDPEFPKARARDFSSERIARQYEELMVGHGA